MQDAPDNDDNDDEPVTKKDVKAWRPLAFKKASVRPAADVTAVDIDEAGRRFEEAQRQAEQRRQRTAELIQAIHERKGAEEIRGLLRRGVDLDAYDKQGDSLLHTAVACRSTDAIFLLIEAGMDVHVKNFKGMTPLMAACSGYDAEECGVMLAAVDPDLSFHVADGTHALHLAAGYYKKTRLVEKLLERGVPADIEDARGRTPLWYALASKVDAAEVLCMAGGFREKDMPALKEAITLPKLYGNEWDYDLLLKQAALLNPEELKKSFPKSGPSALRPPDPGGQEVFGEIAHSTGASFQLQKFSDDIGALQARNYDGQTPLMAALNSNISLWATRDLAWKSDARVRDNAGRTPLHYAVRHTGPGEMIVSVQLTRADVNAQDICGRTPLMISAAKCGEHIDLLLGKGANPDLKDRLGLTALDIAKIRKSDYAVEKLPKSKQAKKPADSPALR
ncbi:MAG: ankyrin repeat domain-containing protein [Alphaproteobacteria bacterium]